MYEKRYSFKYTVLERTLFKFEIYVTLMEAHNDSWEFKQNIERT